MQPALAWLCLQKVAMSLREIWWASEARPKGKLKLENPHESETLCQIGYLDVDIGEVCPESCS